MLQNPKVLFVDDDVNILDGFRNNLRKTHFKVFTADSASRAFEILEREMIDIVISDECMPAMPGHKFLGKVCETWPGTVRLMLSGQAGFRELTSAVNDGQIFKYLNKPASPSELIETLNEAVTLRQRLIDGQRHIHASAAQARNLKLWEQEFPGLTKLETDEHGNIVLENEFFDYPRNDHDIDFVNAVKSGSIKIHYQPIIEPRSLTVHSHEAFPIWNHPERGLILPDQLSKMFTHQGAACAFSKWILNEVFTQKLNWMRRSGKNKTVSLNLPIACLLEEDFVDQLHRKIRDYSVLPRTVAIEINESVEQHALDALQETVNAIRRLGMNVVIDQVKLGMKLERIYSSIMADFLKLDPLLVNQMQSNDAAKSQVKILIDFAHDLNAQVIAEGVNNPGLAKMLEIWNCDLIQGNFVPLEPDGQTRQAAYN